LTQVGTLVSYHEPIFKKKTGKKTKTVAASGGLREFDSDDDDDDDDDDDEARRDGRDAEASGMADYQR
jgi:hypothetical protein